MKIRNRTRQRDCVERGERTWHGHDSCHVIMATLADSPSPSPESETTDGGSGFGIDFLAPARIGDVLTARCIEISKSGRTGVYDVELSNQRGERVAVFRGRSYTLKGKPAVPA